MLMLMFINYDKMSSAIEWKIGKFIIVFVHIHVHNHIV